jgi:protein-arginine kinase activator protein McsA
MDEASFLPEEEEEEGEEKQPPPATAGKKEKSKSSSPPPKMTKLELLNIQLKEAIEKENYEKAAQLRDEIRKLELRD